MDVFVGTMLRIGLLASLLTWARWSVKLAVFLGAFGSAVVVVWAWTAFPNIAALARRIRADWHGAASEGSGNG